MEGRLGQVQIASDLGVVQRLRGRVGPLEESRIHSLVVHPELKQAFRLLRGAFHRRFVSRELREVNRGVESREVAVETLHLRYSKNA